MHENVGPKSLVHKLCRTRMTQKRGPSAQMQTSTIYLPCAVLSLMLPFIWSSACATLAIYRKRNAKRAAKVKETRDRAKRLEGFRQKANERAHARQRQRMNDDKQGASPRLSNIDPSPKHTHPKSRRYNYETYVTLFARVRHHYLHAMKP